MSTEFKNRIYQAEALRVAGKLPEALEQVKDSLIDPETIPQLHDNLLSDYIRQWRIFTVTGMSLAQRRWLAKNARDTLLAVKPIFTTYYHNPIIDARSRGYLTDNEGHLYDHRAECLRDEGKYFLVAFYISGNSKFLNQSVVTFERAVSQAVLDDPKGIALVELGLVKDLQNAHLKRAAGSVYQTYIHQGFELALEPVIESGNQDRLKWLLNNVTAASSHHQEKDPTAKQDLLEVDYQFNSIFGDIGAAKIKRGYKKALFLSRLRRALTWRITRLGIDFSGLDLSTTG